jgi:hypothetical protein
MKSAIIGDSQLQRALPFLNKKRYKEIIKHKQR